jgi:hypothetical protein
VSGNKRFQDSVRKPCTQWMAESGHELAPRGKTGIPSNKMICDSRVREWNTVSTKIIAKSSLETDYERSD